MATVKYDAKTGKKLKKGESTTDALGNTYKQGETFKAPSSSSSSSGGSSSGGGSSSSSSSTGSNISTLSTQSIQKQLGTTSDGIYGQNTTAAVKAFQAANGLKVDGIVGPQTEAALRAKSAVPSTSTVVQDTSAAKIKDNTNSNKVDQTNKLYFGVAGGTEPTGIYGTEVKDATGKVIGTEKFDQKTGKPLTDPNAQTPMDIAGDIKLPDGSTYSQTAPEGFEYQLPTPVEGSKYIYGKDGRAFLLDAAGKVTADPTVDAQYNKIKTANKEIQEREEMYDSYKAGLDEAHIALIDDIKNKAAVLKSKTEELNKRVLGLKRVQGFRTGSTEYTAEIGTGILKAEEQEGMARIEEIDGNLRLAIAQATSAKNEKDFALLERRLDTIDKLEKEKEDSIERIYKTYIDGVKSVNDQLKAITTEERAANDQAIQELNTAAPALIQMFDSLKTDAEKKLWLEKMMAKTGLEASVILGALEKVRLDIANKESILANRDDGGGGSTATKKAQDNDIANIVLTFREVIKQNNWAGIDPTQYETIAGMIKQKYGAAAVLDLEKAIKDAKLFVDDGSSI